MEQRGARNRRAEGAAFGGRHVNFLHLKYFLMVAEELNITRAAERLYISQQSLSNHISNMERELNVKLFTRSPKLALTYAGDLLVDTATQILDLHSQYLNKVGDINRHYMGVLRVGISYTCGLAVLPEILPQFRREFPMVEFSMFEGNSSELEDELAHGRVDLVIAFHPIMLEGVETVPLTEDRLIMVVPKVFTDQVFGPRGGGDAGPVRPGGGYHRLPADALHPAQAGQPGAGHCGPVPEPVLLQAQDHPGDGEHGHHPGYGPGGDGHRHLSPAVPADHPTAGGQARPGGCGPVPPGRPLHPEPAGGGLPPGPVSVPLR